MPLKHFAALDSSGADPVESAMTTPHSPWYSKASTYLGIIPLVVNAFLWLCFSLDRFSHFWVSIFLVGWFSFLLTALLFLVTAANWLDQQRSPSHISLPRMLGTILLLAVYIPSSLVTFVLYAQATRVRSVDIIEAASRKHFSLDEAREMLEDDPECVTESDEFGYTALHHAASRSRNELVTLLISQGADVHAQCADYGQTPLHCAAEHNAVPSIRDLIDAGADPNATDRFGETPLHSAVMVANLDAVKALLDSGANVNATNTEGKTPLDLVIWQEHRHQTEYPSSALQWNECARLLRSRGGIITSDD